MGHIDAVLFDFDGLLADTEPAHMRAFDVAFERLGVPAKSKPEEWAGMSTMKILERAVRDSRTAVPLDAIRKTRREALRELLEGSSLMPYARDVLTRLKVRFKLGLVTSSGPEEIGNLLDKLGVTPFFCVRVLWSPGCRPKPAPDLYLKAVSELQLPPKKIVALEDSENGVCAAKAAGIYCVAVPNAFTRRQDFSQADSVADDLLSAEKVIRKIDQTGLPVD